MITMKQQQKQNTINHTPSNHFMGRQPSQNPSLYYGRSVSLKPQIKSDLDIDRTNSPYQLDIIVVKKLKQSNSNLFKAPFTHKKMSNFQSKESLELEEFNDVSSKLSQYTRNTPTHHNFEPGRAFSSISRNITPKSNLSTLNFRCMSSRVRANQSYNNQQQQKQQQKQQQQKRYNPFKRLDSQTPKKSKKPQLDESNTSHYHFNRIREMKLQLDHPKNYTKKLSSLKIQPPELEIFETFLSKNSQRENKFSRHSTLSKTTFLPQKTTQKFNQLSEEIIKVIYLRDYKVLQSLQSKCKLIFQDSNFSKINFF